MTSLAVDFVHMVARQASQASMTSSQDLDQGCIAYDPTVPSAYKYQPNLAVGLIYTIIFGLSTLALTVQFIWSRKWWYSLLAIGSLGELLGWAARLAAHYCPYNTQLYEMQISVLIIAPCFYSAALYYILAELTRRWGRHYSLLSPTLYLWLFISIDLLSIILQGAGGGIAASSLGASPPKDPQTGSDIMLAGIIIQLVAMCVFTVLLSFSTYRARAVWLRRGTRTTLLLATVFAGDVLILMRNFFRAVELADGWTGYLMTTEWYMCVFDAAAMAIFAILFSAVHPAFFLGFDAGSAYQAEFAERIADSSDEEAALKRGRAGA